MSTTQTGASDLVDALLRDHGEAKRRLQAFDALPPERRPEEFRGLVRLLVGHEAAEEQVVYPALRDCAAGGAAITRDRLAEQVQAERMLSELERLGADDPAFAPSFRRLRDEVLEHAEAEEKTVFWVLKTNVAPAELQRLGERYLRAREQAPTHPHPLAPDTAPANRVAGPAAGVLDRVRDTVRPRLRRKERSHG